ncbi:META domain-containing protein [Helicobacter trogontum]|uniref:META domain-containing protein n=1 Tax=Helicobacter trogontum TaxID=50960 RepID=A0A4U8SAJ6_9HELI|nr:META domain-containing protein [Helicobacter trogontum]TLD83006.1 META domain-containing protein [Helicobacter trogontum]
MKTRIKPMAKIVLLAGLSMPVALLAHGDTMQMRTQSIGQQGNMAVNILGNWRVSLIEIDGAFTRVPEQAGDVTLQINNNQISGVSGCNNFMSPYTFSTNKQQIIISEGASTRRMCQPEEVMRFEDSFLRLLNGTFMIEKNFEGITLVRDNVKIYLVK